MFLLLKMVFVISLLIPLAGCWGRLELNDMAITMGLGLDLADDNSYIVSIQVVDAGEASATKGSLGRSPVVIYSSKGKTIAEAMQRMTASSPRTIYNSHLRILIIGEKLARHGVREVLDYVSRDRQFRTDFPVVIAKNDMANSTLKLLTPIESIPAIQMMRALQNSEKHWAPTIAIHFDELIQGLIAKGRQPVVTGVVMIGNAEAGSNRSNIQTTSPKNRLKFTGLSVFRKDRLIGWMTEEESRGFNIAMGKAYRGTGNVGCDDGDKVALEVQESSSKLGSKLRGDKVDLSIDLKIEANVEEVACSMPMTKDETIRELEKRAEATLRRIIEKTLERVQHEMKSDIFGFGEQVHRHYPKYWKKVSNDWDMHFAEAQVKLNIDVKIRLLGTVTNVIEPEDTQ
ncbi:Ger(x)C family spore germination protein [Paenibacillus sp. PR3]|uniref:Ger(X)C family spore germination protein n=1 Tax=Paenibacillus terricola TaxID=2763503 RepID=A0ABR8MVQ1_9BACL|nr:Ger(x)C family spore germination protein [Paenibacillus terricola]MBD3919146.1 Ger(x)C family spore germination protein [Paenibacillus terricola]